MDHFQVTPRTRLSRLPQRGLYDKQSVYAIIDDALLCHVGAQLHDRPMVQPTCHWRVGDVLYIHGSTKNGLFAALLDGVEACITISHLDGLVLARSAFHHSVNYRSVMVFGTARHVVDPQEKAMAFAKMIDKFSPGRSAEVRPPDDKEMKITTLLAFDLTEVSAKVRTGPPKDDEKDMNLPVWAGVIPLSTVRGEPIKDEG